MPDTKISTPDLWPYALSLYSKPGVKAACLMLQEDADMDVCLILTLCWSARIYRVPYTEAQITEFKLISDDFQSNILKPLRGIREYLKLEAGNGRDESELLQQKEEILAAELTFEQDLLTRYAHMSVSFMTTREKSTVAPDELFRVNLALFWGDNPVLTTDPIKAAVNVITNAAF